MARGWKSGWVVLALSAGLAAAASDWPQWRGPGRLGIAPDFVAPAEWPDKPTLKWRIEVGEGHSSPIHLDGLIYIHARQGEEEVVRCLKPEDGSVVWESRVETPYQMDPAALDHGKGPKSTPTASEGRLFTLGVSGTLSSFDSKTGELLWRRDFKSDFPATSPLFGAALSPLAVGDLLVVHAGGHDKGALLGLDAASGRTRWSWDGDGPAYASPILFESEGVRQVVTQTQDHIVSVDPQNGELLWKTPFSTNYYQNSVTPVPFGGLLIFSGLDQGVFALRPVLRDGQWTVETAWKTTKASFYMNTPVLVDGLLYGLSHKRRGQFVCVNPADGDLRWGSPGREGENASIVAAGAWLFLLTTDSELIVAKTGGAAYEPVARYTVADTPTWAHAAPMGKGVLVKDFKTLAYWVF